MEEKRTLRLQLYVSEAERKLIAAKMAQLGTENLSAYLRKMAVDGYIVRLNMEELQEMLMLLRRSSSNLNQLTRRVNETGRLYEADLEGIQEEQGRLLSMAGSIVDKLSALK